MGKSVETVSFRSFEHEVDSLEELQKVIDLLNNDKRYRDVIIKHKQNGIPQPWKTLILNAGYVITTKPGWKSYFGISRKNDSLAPDLRAGVIGW